MVNIALIATASGSAFGGTDVACTLPVTVGIGVCGGGRLLGIENDGFGVMDDGGTSAWSFSRGD